jgi:hypothetical protein
MGCTCCVTRPPPYPSAPRWGKHGRPGESTSRGAGRRASNQGSSMAGGSGPCFGRSEMPPGLVVETRVQSALQRGSCSRTEKLPSQPGGNSVTQSDGRLEGRRRLQSCSSRSASTEVKMSSSALPRSRETRRRGSALGSPIGSSPRAGAGLEALRLLIGWLHASAAASA